MPKKADQSTCSHESIHKDKGSYGWSGDFICGACGEVFSSREEWERERAERLKAQLPSPGAGA